jgi:hypothetical protein
MSRQRLWIVNVALAVVLIWGGLKLRADWNVFGASHQVSNLQSGPSDVKASLPAVSSVAPIADWTEIASRSPFSFDRNDVNLDLTPAEVAPVNNPKPILLATLLLGNERLALMAKSIAEARASSRVKVGETYEGWQVVDIQDSAVVVASNGARESLSVGRVPVIRSTEKTAGGAPVPAANSVAASPAPASQPAAPNSAAPVLGTGRMSTPPAVVPPGTHVVATPFGYKLEQDPK